jgi:hypothetical protein
MINAREAAKPPGRDFADMGFTGAEGDQVSGFEI